MDVVAPMRRGATAHPTGRCPILRAIEWLNRVIKRCEPRLRRHGSAAQKRQYWPQIASDDLRLQAFGVRNRGHLATPRVSCEQTANTFNPESPMSCPLCGSAEPLIDHAVPGGPAGATAHICAICSDQINGTPEASHWRGLATAIWDETREIQVLAARMLVRLADQDWARDLADQIYLDEETRAWADNVAAESQHKDSNGVTLNTGDTVVLIKDLPVKGAGFTAKRGTAVRGISLVADNPEHIEGRVEGQRIVILTQYVKRK
jgi:protein PhnA